MKARSKRNILQVNESKVTLKTWIFDFQSKIFVEKEDAFRAVDFESSQSWIANREDK